MEPDQEDDDVDTEEDEEMAAIMEQMDEELNDSTVGVSRTVDPIDGQVIQDERVAQDAHILSNLVKSVDASAGGPGPVRNILEGMGQKTM
eukprot:scaffold31_cov171-Amphora_coffeaeformis.AAC.5